MGLLACNSTRKHLPSLVGSCPSTLQPIAVDYDEPVTACDTTGTPHLVAPELLLAGLRLIPYTDQLSNFVVGSIGYMSKLEFGNLLATHNLLENVAIIRLEAGASAIEAEILLGDSSSSFCFVLGAEGRLTMHPIERRFAKK